MTRFGEQLRAWRKKAGVSQATLERTIGRNRGWVNAQEKAVTKPPDKATCQKIAQALDLSDRLVWGTARAERLQGFDEDLWLWYECGDQDAPGATGDEITPTETEETLIEILRWLDKDLKRDAGATASELTNLALSALVEVNKKGKRLPKPMLREAIEGLSKLSEASLSQQEKTLRAIVAILEVAQ
jgi:transcriptional regulator with XRE-family HTH domain